MTGPLLTKIIDQGGLFAVLVLGLFLASRIGWYVARQLLRPAENGKPPGYLVRYFESHQLFLDGLALRDERQTHVCEQNTRLLEKIHTASEIGAEAARSLVAGTDGFTVPFNHSMIDLAKAGRLEFGIHGSMTDDEVAAVRAKVASLLEAVERRHAATLHRIHAARVCEGVACRDDPQKEP